MVQSLFKHTTSKNPSKRPPGERHLGEMAGQTSSTEGKKELVDTVGMEDTTAPDLPGESPTPRNKLQESVVAESNEKSSADVAPRSSSADREFQGDFFRDFYYSQGNYGDEARKEDKVLKESK